MPDLLQTNVLSLETLTEAGIEPGHLDKNSLIATMLDGSRWIYKFGTGEEEDEVMAYRLARMLFNGVVPETYPCDLGRGLGSAQHLVKGKSAHAWAEEDLHAFFDKVRNPVIMRDLANMIVLDYMIGNRDRHGHNWFIQPNGRIAAIDNGFAGNDLNVPFAHTLEPAGRAMLVDDCAITPGFIAIMKSVAARIESRSADVHRLGIDASFDRRQQICLSCVWDERVQQLLEALANWRRGLAKFCGYHVYSD